MMEKASKNVISDGENTDIIKLSDTQVDIHMMRGEISLIVIAYL